VVITQTNAPNLPDATKTRFTRDECGRSRKLLKNVTNIVTETFSLSQEVQKSTGRSPVT
jgi:hypothetical protein